MEASALQCILAVQPLLAPALPLMRRTVTREICSRTCGSVGHQRKQQSAGERRAHRG